MSSRKYIFNIAGEAGGKDEVVVPPRPVSIALIEDALYEPGQPIPAWLKAGQPPDQSRLNNDHTRVRRNSVQQIGIDRIKDDIQIRPIYDDDTATAFAQMFGETHETLDWAYGCFLVDNATKHQLIYGEGMPLFQTHIYLFNVLVAFEWQPSEHNVAMLERAARRAADFLFDVTEGWMTFGQVLIGGPDLMDCADIQVLASNRLLPRSWVGGLHEPHKYMPIRLGRGMWQKNSRGSIPWDEPEGYRTIVHEWAHYALELLDDYADTHLVYIRDDTQPIQSGYEARRSNRELIVPSISQAVESIMSTLEGTSELTAKRGNDPRKRKDSEWEAIIKGFDGLEEEKKPRFPRIKDIPKSIEGPLPLRELPHIAWVGSAKVESEKKVWSPELLLPLAPPELRAEHCWVYILKQPFTNGIPTDIIAQGTLDTQIKDGFRLFGAEEGDHIVLIGNDLEWHERVLRAEIVIDTDAPCRQDGRKMIEFLEYDDCTPEHFPIVDIIPEKVRTSKVRDIEARTAQVRVRVPSLDNGNHAQTPRIYLYPADYVNANGRSELRYIPLSSDVPTTDPVALDGHVLVDLGNKKFVIATYSQGGGPSTGSPVGGTPLTPGSSEGNLMVFFADRDEYPDHNRHHAAIRVVTTRLPGGVANEIPEQDEAASASSGSGDGASQSTGPGSGASESKKPKTEARGYAYTLCSNAAIPSDYAPTLSLFYDKRTELQDGEAVIHRQDKGKWIPITSYRPEGAWYVAAPLDQQTAPNLIDPNLHDDIPRVERYRLFLVPREWQE